TLFSLFLDTRKITAGRTVVVALELAVSATGYTIERKLWPDQHVEGEYLFRDTLTLRITRSTSGFNVRYVNTDERWSESQGTLATVTPEGYVIPLSSTKGFNADLILTVQMR